jgi:hypothetical protein
MSNFKLLDNGFNLKEDKSPASYFEVFYEFYDDINDYKTIRTEKASKFNVS